jgi:type IV conjugative transfer system protein TraL
MHSFEDIYVKNYEFIDSKPYFLSWEMDTFIVFSTFFGLALMVTDSFLPFSILVAAGVLSAIVYDKIKNAKIKGYFWHILYLIGLNQPKTLPPSYMRIFVGG